jgi:tRNA pseudouridine55 synthase
MDGVININKPRGITSHDVVMQARRITGEKRIGHTGTLDPLATGVLVLCAGKATRIAQYLEAGEKEYRAVLRLGITTDTLDAEGQVLTSKSYDSPSRETIGEAMNGFLGEILQTPPAFSAIKIKGTPSYKLARQGRPTPLAPRAVRIFSIQLDRYEDPLIDVTVHCSKGVYIRTLCADIGNVLGMGAHLTELQRTRSGSFSIEGSFSLEQLSRMASEGTIAHAFLSINEALSHFPAVVVSPDEALRVMHGNRILYPAMHTNGEVSLVRIQNGEGSLLAVARAGEGELRPELVFS